jgi:hypothetical protein
MRVHFQQTLPIEYKSSIINNTRSKFWYPMQQPGTNRRNESAWSFGVAKRNKKVQRPFCSSVMSSPGALNPESKAKYKVNRRSKWPVISWPKNERMLNFSPRRNQSDTQLQWVIVKVFYCAWLDEDDAFNLKTLSSWSARKRKLLQLLDLWAILEETLSLSSPPEAS